MGEVRGLTEQVLELVVDQTRDHESALSDLSVRIEPMLGELIDLWVSASREAFDGLTRTGEVSSPESLRSWFDGLGRRDLPQFFSNVAAWSREIALAGLSYDGALKLLREYQRRAVPFLMRVFAAGPELETALDVFDDLFDAGMVMIGAAYIDLYQERAVAESRAQALGQVFGGATHALNNWLSVVLGRLAVLIDGTRDAEMRDELRRIEESAAMSAQMVQRLQEFARRDRAEKLSPAHLNLLLRDAAEITRFVWRDQAETYGVVIDVVRDFADVPPVLARPAALREALVVMIVNAVGELPRGGLITLRTERRGDRVLASVINSGLGADAPASRTTPPFFAAGGLPNVGLSLRVAARTAADLNGTLTVETKPGRGTTTTLALPVAQGVGEEKEHVAMAAHPASILFIDNEPSVRDAFTRLLELYGHRVTAAENGEKGIAAFNARKFDLVFTDLGMPGMSGWDVAREIKKIDPTAQIVLVTGWPIDLSAQKSKETGVDKVVTKPLDMPQVLGLIDDAMAARGKI